ncbi:MAG TPA: Gfo/Idh/MocA family oxidoreductase [Bryobacteraceae bacterium]|nr:Gfo/Idh/MocA family oxidoreductase [Bryobacteraceae bacterium]
MIRIGVVGYGYWGPNLVRNFVDAPTTQVVLVSDLRQDRLDVVQRRYPFIETTTDYRMLIADPRIDAVAISTPVSSHFQLAMEALQAGKHVLVEKPMTASTEEALRLIDEAEKRNLVLMVDHTFIYTGAVRKTRELIDAGDLGQIYYYDSTRVNLGLFQHDVNVLWDLAVHDLSIMEFILPEEPVEVSATGIAHVAGVVEDTAFLSLFYSGSIIAHLNVNWLSPVKIRRTLVGGTKKMIVYDDIENSEKIKVYDKGVTVKNGPESLYKVLVSYRSGDMYAPRLDVTEALLIEVQHFAECIENSMVPRSDGLAGLRVVSLLEAASESMRRRGSCVKVRSFPGLGSRFAASAGGVK